jgi:hypothetical protein
MKQYVCVRIPRMDDVNIALFDYDRYNTLYFFILNADEQIYLRYGGRDAESQDSYLSLDSIELALKQGLDLHRQYQQGTLAKAASPKPTTPREIPLLVERTFARNQCVECHLIGDFLLQQREQEGNLDKLSQMFRSPDLKTIGIHLDVPQGLLVKEAKGAVEQAGMRQGDVIRSINGTSVWTFGDLQWFLDKTPRSAKQISLAVERGGQIVPLTVTLPPRWWWVDIRYKQLTVDPRVYFESSELPAAEKAALNLPPGSFASRVKYVSGFAETLKAHELKVGDVILSVDGETTDDTANTADFYIRLRKTAGNPVTLDVLRGQERLKMELKTFRMSFRK